MGDAIGLCGSVRSRDEGVRRMSSVAGLLLLFCSILSGGSNLRAAEAPPARTGVIQGRLLDRPTKSPLPGATVIVVRTGEEVITGEGGEFLFSDVPVGSHSVQFSYPEMIPLTLTDIIVKSGRTTYVSAEFELRPAATESVTVLPRYFETEAEQATSGAHFSAEEVRRAPASAGDVSRIIYGLPSVAKVNDEMNSLVVRGGSPAENAFFIDNIEVPNVNHFPIQGTSGGPIGLLNIEFIDDVSFYAGGFSAIYGDKLSSVVDIAYREGSHDRFEAQTSMDFAGFGVAAEGPLGGSSTSYMIGVRRSYLDLLTVAIGTGVAPRYSDIQGKLAIDIGPADKLSILGIAGNDRITWERDSSFEDGNPYYGDYKTVEGVAGVTWFRAWGASGYSSTTLGYNSTRYDELFFNTVSTREEFENDSTERSMAVRNVSHFKLAAGHSLTAGFELKRIASDYEYFAAESTDPLGNTLPEVNNLVSISTWKQAAFAEYDVRLSSAISARLGLRFDRLTYSGNRHASPRLSLAYRLSPRTSLTASAGLFYQNLSPKLLYSRPEYRELRDPRSAHYVLGMTRLLGDNTRLTVEAYDKEYDFLPIDPQQPSLFVFDADYGSGFLTHAALVDEGRAYTRGIEVLLQKKLKDRLYGTLGASIFTARYRGLDGVWRNRSCDNRALISIEGGYKPNQKYEYSMRWIIAGGVPYTPYDVAASEAANDGLFDATRINAERMPAYHSLNLRFDRRFYFKHLNVTAYMSVWNLYNRKNIASYYWNEIENKADQSYQWSILPVGGIEVEF